jgi:hypothetical protein
MLTAAPMTTVTKICVVIRRAMLPIRATAAMRMPISRSRRRTEQEEVQGPAAGVTASNLPRRQNNSPSNRLAARPRKQKRVDANPKVCITVSNLISDSQQAAIAEPERTIPQGVLITRLPASRRFNSVRATHCQTAKPALGSTPDALKPAIALAGSPNTKIVVVSAEQVKRERGQVAPRAPLRPRPPASGLSGRLAFAVLFNDEIEA